MDGGKTTLMSPVFDLSGQGGVTVNYYRWFSNDTGNAPGEDPWRVQVSDGGPWQPLENTLTSNRSWLQRSFALEDYIGMTATVQFRFIAEDVGAGSVVEAAVDDFSLTGYVAPVDSEAPVVELSVPDGGEVYASGDEVTIIWAASDDIGVVQAELRLSTDGGQSYPELIASGAFNGEYVWLVPSLESGSCRIQVTCFDALQNEGDDASAANFAIQSAVGVEELPIREVMLAQNFPNPFNPRTDIQFALPHSQQVMLKIYSVEGKLVRTLVSGRMPAGRHTVAWVGDNDQGGRVASGLYFYRLDTASSQLTRTMLLLK